MQASVFLCKVRYVCCSVWDLPHWAIPDILLTAAEIRYYKWRQQVFFFFFFSPWSISLCLEAQWFIPWDKKKTLDVDFYFLSQDTELFPMTSNFWSESVQLVYCQRRGKPKTKFCREVTKSTRHAFTTNVCTDRNLHGKLSTSARTHFCPSQSSIFQGLALRMHSIPTHVPGFLHVQPESPSIQHTPP